MIKIDCEKKLMANNEQDIEIIYSKLKERLFQLQKQYFEHHIENVERIKIRKKIDTINKQLFYLKKILDLQITYKGDLHETLLSRL